MLMIISISIVETRSFEIWSQEEFQNVLSAKLTPTISFSNKIPISYKVISDFFFLISKGIWLIFFLHNQVIFNAVRGLPS